MTPRPRLRWLQRGFLVLGLLLVGLWSKSYFESRGFQSAESMKLEAALREAESGSDAPAFSNASFIGPPASDPPKHAMEQKGVLGRIEIPRLHITAIVAEGVDMKTLSRAVGHVTSTALPGSPGNCALAGHRDTFLRGLGEVRANEVIRIVTLEGTYTYRLEWSAVVEPKRVDLLNPTASRSLTLITCYPFAFVGHAPQRFVVRARQVEAVAEHEDHGVSQAQGLTTEGR
jgi:sortase A